MNVMYDTQKCAVMFEGYDSQDIVSFDDIEPFEVCNTDQLYLLIESGFSGRILRRRRRGISARTITTTASSTKE
jgi:hypothetical protein